MDFKLSFGEQISDESWVMRDIWQTTNVEYGAKWGLATVPKKLQSSAIKLICYICPYYHNKLLQDL